MELVVTFRKRHGVLLDVKFGDLQQSHLKTCFFPKYLVVGQGDIDFRTNHRLWGIIGMHLAKKFAWQPIVFRHKEWVSDLAELFRKN